MPQPRWKGQFCKKSKLDKFSNFAVQAKHAIEGESQSQSCFESKVEGGFRLIDLSFFIEQLRRGCSTCKSNISLLDIQGETKLGLASIIYIKCAICNSESKLYTSQCHAAKGTHDDHREQRNIFDINTRCAAGKTTLSLLLHVLKLLNTGPHSQ